MKNTYIDFSERFKSFKEVESALDDRRLLNALQHLKEDMVFSPDGDCSDEWKDIHDTYSYMLDYMKKGVSDEHREDLYRNLLQRTYLLNDRLLYVFRMQHMDDGIEIIRKDLQAEAFPCDMTSLFLQIKKWGNIMKGVEAGPLDDPAGDTAIIRKYEDFYIHLFNAVYTSFRWTKEDLESALQLITDKDVYKYDLRLIESAVMLSLCAYYDENKLRFLIALVREVHDYAVQARAIVGIAVCCLRHSCKLLLNDELMAVLTVDLPENPVYLEGMRLLQKEFFICQQTDSATKKLDEEIIPAMMNSEYFRLNKFGFQNVDEFLSPEDSEPNKNLAGERENLQKKFREIQDMRLNGLDVYMTTFAHLKNFPFFNQLANWFYPFNPYHYAVKGICFTEGKKMDVVSTLVQGLTFCDSDRYSFCMLMGQIGTMQRDMIGNKLSEGCGKDELQMSLEAEQKGLEFVLEIRSYLQDLYRFYKLYPAVNRQLMFNPYSTDLNFLHNSVLCKVINDEDSLLAIAEGVYKSENYAEALVYLQKLDTLGSRQVSVYQREGYCLQMLKKNKEAVKAYLKADLIKPGEMWTYRQLGYCYRHLGEYGKALDFYLKIEASDPDNKFVLLRTGECLLQEKRYKEAQQRFFKVEYNEPEYLPALRAIAWCAFLSQDLERAQKYYEKIIELIKRQTDKHLSAEWATDYLNAGHTAVVCGRLNEAILFYRKYAQCSQTEDFQELWDDFPILHKTYHYKRLDMQLILEAVRSEI